MTEHTPVQLDRRRALAATGLAAAAVVTVAACDTYGANDNASAASDNGAKQDKQQGAELATTGEVPVGGGVIKGDTVITQPTAGNYQGFSSTCTHLGCKVAEVSNGKINCKCHNSSFNLDGSVAGGPAPRALDARAVRVEGDRILAG
ncbi:QcrA and Rieske domain-containing protein [Nocardia sp. IFM 10818]